MECLNPKSSSLILLIAFFTLAGCQTSVKKGEQTQDVVVRPVTEIPTKFAMSFAEEDDTQLITVPAGMLKTVKIKRPRAEMRSGPGVKYGLLDEVLAEGQMVLHFETVGVWLQVMLPGSWDKGWIHRDSAIKPHASERSMQVASSKLPNAFAMRTFLGVKDYQSKRSLNTLVPKGSIFKTLQIAGNGLSLVWIPGVNSVMWVPRKDVQ